MIWGLINKYLRKQIMNNDKIKWTLNTQYDIVTSKLVIL